MARPRAVIADKALEKALQIAGSQTALTEAIGVSQQAVRDGNACQPIGSWLLRRRRGYGGWLSAQTSIRKRVSGADGDFNILDAVRYLTAREMLKSYTTP